MLEIEKTIEAIESGETNRYDEDLSRQQAEEYQKQALLQEEGKGFTILLLESNVQLQNTLREKLKELGYRVLITSDPERGLERFQELDPAETMPADCILFGCAGLGKEGIKAFHKFTTTEETSEVPAILLVTKAQAAMVRQEWVDKDCHQALKIPLNFKRLKKALRKLLNIEVAQE